MYELQLFDSDCGQYVSVKTGEDPRSLMDMARGMARRVIGLWRENKNIPHRLGGWYEKPLPLKPRVLHGMSGKPRKYRPDTMIEPADLNTLVKRALRHYETRAKAGETNIPVYVWAGSQFAYEMHILKARPEIYNVIELNPEDYL